MKIWLEATRRSQPRTPRARHARRVPAAAVVLVVSSVFFSVAATVFVFHLEVLPVLSGSMRPTFAPGSIIVTRPIPVAKVRTDMVIVFTPPGWSAPVAHRVVSVSGEPAHPVITTKGDANPVADSWRARLIGTTVPQVVASVPLVGWVVGDIGPRWARVLLTLGIGLVVCIAGVSAILCPGPEEVLESPPNEGSNDDPSPREGLPGKKAA